MAQVIRKFIKDNAVNGTKILLDNNQTLRARNAANSADVDILKVNASDRIEFLSVPQSSTAPSVAADLVNKAYIDNLISGIKWKAPVRVATTANITLSGTQTIDGVALLAGDRVLVKDQTAQQSNGIYVVAAGAWSRATDADQASEVAAMAVFVEEGSTSADKGFVCTANTSDSIIIDTTALPFVQFSASGSYVAGNGINISGSVISVVLAANPGLEFDSGALRVKTDASGAIVRNANGIAVNLESVNPSIQISANEIGVKFSGTTSALAKDASGLKVNLESSNPSLQVSSNELGVKFDAAGALSKGASGVKVNVDNSTMKINGTNNLEGLKDEEQIITLSATDIANKYVDLAHTAHSSSSISLCPVGGIPQERGADFTVSLTGGAGGVTRLSFVGGDLEPGVGAAALVQNDKLIIRYTYL